MFSKRESSLSSALRAAVAAPAGAELAAGADWAFANKGATAVAAPNAAAETKNRRRSDCGPIFKASSINFSSSRCYF